MSKYAHLSDDDFMNGFDSTESNPTPPVEEPVVPQEPIQDTQQPEEQPLLPSGSDENPNPEVPVDNPADPDGKPADAGTDPVPPEPVKPEAQPDAVPNPEAQPEVPAEAPINYEAFHSEVMKPLKANGREFQIKSPEEARRLMEMGAGYGRKMREIAPHVKAIKTLERFNLLSEDKLNFLIDLNNGNPEAIKKLLKDKEVNPLDLDIDQEAKYEPVNHSVSNAEIVFGDALATVQQRDGGLETIRHIHSTWDKESVNALGANPELLLKIQEQRELGVYTQVVAEMDRRSTFGTLPDHLPFLERYTRVANDIVREAQGRQDQVVTPQSPAALSLAPQPPKPQVIATRVATPQSTANDPRVLAAAPPRSTPRNAAPAANLAKMSDADFMKQFEG